MKIFKLDPINKKMNIIEIDNELSSMQKVVGGLIERAFTIKIENKTFVKESGIVGLDLYVNEEGLFREVEGMFQVIQNGEAQTSWLSGVGFFVGYDKEGESVSIHPEIFIEHFGLDLQFAMVNKSENNDVIEKIMNNMQTTPTVSFY